MNGQRLTVRKQRQRKQKHENEFKKIEKKFFPSQFTSQFVVSNLDDQLHRRSFNYRVFDISSGSFKEDLCLCNQNENLLRTIKKKHC